MLRCRRQQIISLIFFEKLSTVFSECEEEAVRQFDSAWLTEEGMDALDALVTVVQTDCDPDDYDAFVKAVLDKIEAEQRVEEEDSESDSDLEGASCHFIESGSQEDEGAHGVF